MSFAPYQAKFATGNIGQTSDIMSNKMDALNINDDNCGNNDTKMSNNEAFLAYISKNTEDDDDE